MRRIGLAFCTVLFTGCAMGPLLGGGGTTIDRIKTTSTITLGYRDGAVPFSFIGDDGKPRGYSVELCERVVESLKGQLALPTLNVKWVPVTAETRIPQVVSGQIDLECGTTSMTLSRQAQVDFSLMTFVDGGTFLANLNAGPKALGELNRLRIAVSAGTTTEKVLRNTLARNKVEAEVVPVKSHSEAMALLREGKVAAYASDRTVLIGLALTAGQGATFGLSDLMLSYEPYGLMMRRDPDFRLAVNRALAGIYREGAIVDIYRRWFGRLGEPSDLLKAVYSIQALPE